MNAKDEGLEVHSHHHGHAEANGHEQTHGHGHANRGLIGILQGFVGPHSHDAKDSLDQALEGGRDGIRAVRISLAILLVTAGSKPSSWQPVARLPWWVTPCAMRPMP